MIVNAEAVNRPPWDGMPRHPAKGDGFMGMPTPHGQGQWREEPSRGAAGPWTTPAKG